MNLNVLHCLLYDSLNTGLTVYLVVCFATLQLNISYYVVCINSISCHRGFNNMFGICSCLFVWTHKKPCASLSEVCFSRREQIFLLSLRPRPFVSPARHTCPQSSGSQVVRGITHLLPDSGRRRPTSLPSHPAHPVSESASKRKILTLR